jgi:hypothetical protein
MSDGTPWFKVWPQAGGIRRPLAVPPAAPPAQMKTVAEVVRDSRYPPRFLQIIPFAIAAVPPGASAETFVQFDRDFPYRMDALVFQFQGPTDPEFYASILVELPSGRRLTRQAVDAYSFNGTQGGKDFIPFRHRFNPTDIVQVLVSNSHASTPLALQGFVYGYKTTEESRL